MTLITNADTAHVAPVTAGSHRVSIASYSRPANTTAYAARDVVGDATTAAIEFPNCGRSGRIYRAHVGVEEDGTAVAMELYIFDEEPTNHADNAILTLVSADIPKLVAVFDFATADQKTLEETNTAADGSVVYLQALEGAIGQPNAYVTDDTPASSAVSGSLFGLLVVAGAWTPTENSTKIHIKLQLQID